MPVPVILSKRKVRGYLTDYSTALELIGSPPPILERQDV